MCCSTREFLFVLFALVFMLSSGLLFFNARSISFEDDDFVFIIFTFRFDVVLFCVLFFVKL